MAQREPSGGITERGRVGVKILVIVQGPAYGTEAAYNGLRLAGNLAKPPTAATTSTACWSRQRTTAQRSGCAEPAWMHAGSPSRCSSPRPAGRVDEVTDWVLWADKTITF